MSDRQAPNKPTPQNSLILIPPVPAALMDRLEKAGYEAWAVGGCVRDSLMGGIPHDWDLCTSALPEETKACFAGEKVIETGLIHGTLTVLQGKTPYEITTYRQDGAYTDHRRPDKVRFVSSLREDLARRDFTVNAMAARPGELIDLFGGRQDIKARLIRCVGNPEQRLEEDSLRILRAMRFASVLNFEVEPATAAAMLKKKNLLSQVSAERVLAELDRILLGPAAARVLRQFAPIVEQVLPELAPCDGCDQQGASQGQNGWEHTLRVIERCPPRLWLRWAALLQGAEDSKTLGNQETKGDNLSNRVFERLKSDKQRREEVAFLMQYQNAALPDTPQGLRELLRRQGKDRLREMMVLRRCSARAQSPAPEAQQELTRLDCFEQALEALLAQNPVLHINELAVNGQDLINIGFRPGPALGQTLKALLAQVEQGVPNQKTALLSLSAQWLAEQEKTPQTK